MKSDIWYIKQIKSCCVVFFEFELKLYFDMTWKNETYEVVTNCCICHEVKDAKLYFDMTWKNETSKVVTNCRIFIFYLYYIFTMR